MLPSHPKLTPVERCVARRYWQMLLFPVSHQQLHEARYSLKNHAPQVVAAVLDALAVVWDKESAPRLEENPF